MTPFWCSCSSSSARAVAIASAGLFVVAAAIALGILASPRPVRYEAAVVLREGRQHLARNISHSGILIDADPPYPIGSIVRVVFTYPGSDVELTALGEVRHHECHPTLLLGECVEVMGVGIAFLRFEDGVVRTPQYAAS